MRAARTRLGHAVEDLPGLDPGHETAEELAEAEAQAEAEEIARDVLRDLEKELRFGWEGEDYRLSSRELRALIAEVERPAREALGAAWAKGTIAEGIAAKCAWLERLGKP